MSWLYLPERAEDCLHRNGCLDGKLSVMSKTQNIPLKSSRPELETACSTTHQFGTTPEHSTGDPGVDAWILSLRDSRVSLSAQRENKKEKMTNEICGLTPFVSLEKSDPNGVFWKTYLGYFFRVAGISVQYCKAWPKAGMMQNGVCYRRPKWELRIKEIESGLWPTIQAQESGWKIGGKVEVVDKNGNPPEHWNQRWYDKNTGRLVQKGLTQVVQMWHTPRAIYGEHPGMKSLTHLTGQVQHWPTPRQFMHKDAITNRGKCNLGEVVGGKLSPTWVELLMGWPRNWTCLEPISMIEFNKWLMGFREIIFNGAESDAREILSDVRQEAAVQQEVGRLSNIPATKVLQPELREHTSKVDKTRIQLESKKTSEREMRGLRGDTTTSSPSYRSRHQEQQSGEHPNSMQNVPRLLAQYGKEAWMDGSWENGVPRVTKDIAARVDRLKAIGNGQVPFAVAAAWHLLTY